MRKRISIVFALTMLALPVSGCGTMANDRRWGQDATIAPGWARVGQAAVNAATSPETWAPAAGALAFQIGRADRNLENWAAEKTPVFGSQERADRASYNLRDASTAIWLASCAATPSGDDGEDWIVAKTEGVAVQTGAGILMRETVGVLKSSVNRTRPNGVDKGSFPSAHASAAALNSTFAFGNIETLGWPRTATTASQVGLGALTLATAWARVEANQHFPSDVLAGMALGHFFGVFFTDAFLGLNNPRNAAVLIEPSREGAIGMLRINY